MIGIGSGSWFQQCTSPTVVPLALLLCSCCCPAQVSADHVPTGISMPQVESLTCPTRVYDAQGLHCLHCTMVHTVVGSTSTINHACCSSCERRDDYCNFDSRGLDGVARSKHTCITAKLPSSTEICPSFGKTLEAPGANQHSPAQQWQTRR
jgi:hypothetical protein